MATIEPKRARRCSASLPYPDAEDGWHYCVLNSGHNDKHLDGLFAWEDGDTVEVTTVEDVRAVEDHAHEFVGDQDTCLGHVRCEMTWHEFKHQRSLEGENRG